LEGSLAVSYKTKHVLTVRSNIHAPRYLPERVRDLHPHRNLHTDVYGSFVQNSQNLEEMKSSFSNAQTHCGPSRQWGILLSAKQKGAATPWKDLEEALMHTTE